MLVREILLRLHQSEKLNMKRIGEFYVEQLRKRALSGNFKLVTGGLNGKSTTQYCSRYKCLRQ